MSELAENVRVNRGGPASPRLHEAGPPVRRTSRFGVGRALFLIGGCLVAAASVAAPPPGKTASPAASPVGMPCVSADLAKSKLGIEIVALRLAQGGNILDLRYKVLDPAKAHDCLNRHVSPYLKDPASGAKLTVPDMPYVGALRQTAAEPLAGKVYFILFWNPGRAIKAGQKVQLVVGGTTLVDGLVVS